MVNEAVRSVSLEADVGQDLPARRFVRPSVSGIVLAGAGGDAVGVSLELYDDSEQVAGRATRTISVALLDGAKMEVEAGAAVTAGDPVESDATGRAITAAGEGDVALGYALNAAAGAGEFITIVGLKPSAAAQLSVASHFVFAAGEFTTAGGDADEAITVTGAVATDIVLVTLQTAGAVPVTIIDAAAGVDVIDVDMSADPSTDHVLSFMVLRATV